MPTIVPIRDLRKTSEISELAHTKQEPIFVTKNGYSDLVVLSAELYDKMMSNSRIDAAILEAEEDFKKNGKAVDARKLWEELDKKFYG